jgi:hypothetical protein
LAAFTLFLLTVRAQVDILNSETVSCPPFSYFSQMTTIRRVAQKAGVSIATVSRVVNGSTAVAPELRDRVLEAVSRCGYAPTIGRR